jgi:hypothetical protein
MMIWEPKHPQSSADHLGLLPTMVSSFDPHPAVEQLDASYAHGGGWRPFPGFTMKPNGNLAYKGDPDTPLLWEAKLRDETIRVYESAWVAVVQPDGAFQVCRMD